MSIDKDKAKAEDSKRDKREKSEELDEELKDTFPASDPPEGTQPGGQRTD